jgi:hypothetical protein
MGCFGNLLGRIQKKKSLKICRQTVVRRIAAPLFKADSVTHFLSFPSGEEVRNPESYVD